MSFNFGSTVTNDFSTFSDDEKLNYALKLALNRVQTWGKTPWYEEPSVVTSTLPNLTLKNKIPPGSDIETYYLVDPDLGKATDRNVLKAIGSNDYNTLTINTIDGSTYASNPPIRTKSGTQTISVTNNGETKTLLKGISKTMIAKYVYWQNKLTGKVTKSDGTGTTTNTTSGTGTYPDKTAPFASFMTLSNVQNDSYVNDRRVSTMKEGGSYSTLYDTLESYYSGLEIIHWSNIDADGTAPPSKRHPFFKVFIGLPTYSTYSDALKTNFNNIGVSSSQSGDNIGFTNKLLEGAMGSINGYKFYLSTWNKKTQQFKQKKEDTYGDANNLNILYFLSYSGFILNYGEKNILDGKSTSIDDTSISIKYPPTISFVKYTGETFSDGIISQGDTLPAVEVSNDKDLFINTTDNTIHRLEDNNGTKTWVGIGGSGGSGGSSSGGGSTTTTTEKGQILETLSGVCDGRTIVIESGSYTLGNVTATQELTTSWAEISGTSISYKPPSGAKYICYTLEVFRRWDSSETSSNGRAMAHYMLYLDNDEIVGSRTTRGGGTYEETYDTIMWTFEIGNTDDIANGKLLSWDSYKTISVRSREFSQYYQVQLHVPLYWDGQETGQPIIKPRIKIDVIGDNTTNSTITRKGQVLEVLLGRAESGESVEVDTGVYTFPLNTNYDNTKLNTSYQKVDSSQLTYTAPEGTERFFYEYRMRGGYDNPTGVTLIYQLYINDIAFGNEEQVATYQQRNMVLIQSIITKSDLESSGININLPLNIYYKMKTNTGEYTLLEWDESATKRLDDYIKVTAIGERTSSSGGGGGGGGGVWEDSSSNSNIFYNSSGSVGIGTDNPQAVLHVAQKNAVWDATSNPDPVTLRVEGGILVTDVDADIHHRIKIESDGQILIYGGYSPNETANVKISGNAHENNDGKTYFNAGNVGIGTTSPTALLDIQAPAGDTKLLRLGSERPWLFQSIRSNAASNNPAGTSNLHLTSSHAGKWFYIDLDSKTNGGTEFDGEYNTGEGDPIFGVYTHGEHDKVYVKNKLGIGTTSPHLDAKLDIGGNGGNIYFSSTENISQQSDANYDTYFPSYANSIIRYADTQVAYVGGGAKLNKSHEIEFGYDMNAKTTLFSDTMYYPERHAMHFKLAGDGDSPTLGTKMSIISNGNVGIGTTSPEDKLHIYNGGIWVTDDPVPFGNHGVHIYSSYSTGGVSGWFEIQEDHTELYGARSGYNGDTNDWRVQTKDNSTSWTTRFRVSRTGGIYSDTNLHVDGRIYTTNRIHINSSDAGIFFGDGTAHTFLGTFHGGSNPYVIGFHRSSWKGPYFNSSNGYIGVGVDNPTAPLDIELTVSADADKAGWWDGDDGAWYGNDNPPSGYGLQTNGQASFGDVNPDDPAVNYSIHCKGGIYMEGNSIILITSDRRIKKNIVDMSSNYCLKTLREIPVREYKYIDKKLRGSGKTIGFIAQEVDEKFAMAVTKKNGCIPNEYRILNDYTWYEITDVNGNTLYQLTINDLVETIDFQKYRFYVTDQDISNLIEDEIMLEKISLKDKPKSFIFKKKWVNIFLWGKYVANFHTIDKNKLFTLNFSATQEIDRIQQQQLLDISQNTINTQLNKTEINLLKHENEELKHENEELKTELNIIKLQNQTLQDRLESIEKRLYDANI
jgi:hypothetical protein